MQLITYTTGLAYLILSSTVFAAPIPQYVKLCPCFHRFLETELFRSLLPEFGSSRI
jgi:hypothetical protein